MAWAREDAFDHSMRYKSGREWHYDSVKLIKWYIKHKALKDTLGLANSPVLGEGKTDQEIVDYATEKARLTKAQADHEELKVAERMKLSIPTTLVIYEISAAINAAKAKLLGVTSKVRSRYPEVSDDIAIEIEGQIREALDELGQENKLPSGLEQHLDEYLQSVDTSPKTDAIAMG